MSKDNIVWAIDAFSEDTTQMKTGALLKAFNSGVSSPIEPVSVLSPYHFRLPIPAFKERQGEFQNQAETRIHKWAKKLKLHGLSKPSFVMCDEYSQRKSVTTLLDYAKEKNAGLIALNTHARKGLNRMMLGSFAETLMLQSSIPLLIVNPKTKVPTKIKTIFFPTDLSAASHQGFRAILPIAKRLKAQIIFYHKVEYVIPETYSMVYQTAAYAKYLDEDVKVRRKQAETWAKQATVAGVKATLVFDQSPNFVTQAILKSASKHKADLITIVSTSGTASTTLLGSITRQVVREAKVPVWALHVMH